MASATADRSTWGAIQWFQIQGPRFTVWPISRSFVRPHVWLWWWRNARDATTATMTMSAEDGWWTPETLSGDIETPTIGMIWTKITYHERTNEPGQLFYFGRHVGRIPFRSFGSSFKDNSRTTDKSLNRNCCWGKVLVTINCNMLSEKYNSLCLLNESLEWEKKRGREKFLIERELNEYRNYCAKLNHSKYCSNFIPRHPSNLRNLRVQL